MSFGPLNELSRNFDKFMEQVAKDAQSPKPNPASDKTAQQLKVLQAQLALVQKMKPGQLSTKTANLKKSFEKIQTQYRESQKKIMKAYKGKAS